MSLNSYVKSISDQFYSDNYEPGLSMREVYWAVFTISLLVAFALYTEIIDKNPASIVHSFMIGYICGCVIRHASDIMTKIFQLIFYRQPLISSNIKISYVVFTLFMLAVILIAGLFLWYGTWVGKTGLSLGIGVFCANVLYSLGITKIINKYKSII